LNKRPTRSSITDKWQQVDASNPDAAAIDQAAAIIRRGGVVVFPTRGLYGLGADALNPEAVDRVFRIKQRSAEKPISVLIRDLQDLADLVKAVDSSVKRLIDHFWPGKLTIILEAAEGVPQGLTGGSGKLGLRIPGHPVARALVNAVGRPITATSANLSGVPGCSDLADLSERVACEAEMIIDAGQLEGGRGSTVIDATVSPPVILREGAVSAEAIQSFG